MSKKKKVYLLHGFNVRDGGESTIGTIADGLICSGFKVRQIKYGHIGRVGVRACNDNVAATIASAIEPGSSIVAHSNGAALVYEAAQLGAQFGNVFLINPALDSTKDIKNAKQVTVYYSPSDPWTKLAKYIPFSNWGNMGAVGYRGRKSDCVHLNVNLDKLTGLETKHSGIFQSPWTVAKLVHHLRGLL